MRSASLLAIDEDTNLSEALRSIADACGLEVEIVERSRDFVLRYPVLRPDVTIFGLVMRDMDGLEILAWLFNQVDRLYAVVVTRPDCPYRAAARSLVGANNGMNVVFVTRSPDEAVFRHDLSEALAAVLLRKTADGAAWS